MRIEQAYIASGLQGIVQDDFLSIWNLREYDNPEEPAFFMGFYWDWDEKNKKIKVGQSIDIDNFLNHKGFKIAHWSGGEFYGEDPPEYSGQFSHLLKRFREKENNKNMNILAVDQVDVSNLNKFNVPFKTLKIPYFDINTHQPTMLQDKIYSHVPAGEMISAEQKGQAREYEPIFELVFEYSKLMDTFSKQNFCFPLQWIHGIENLIPYYEKSYCNIKPNHFRGEMTGWRLGLMGRKTLTSIKNRNTVTGPHIIYYTNYEDLKRLVEIESKKIGTIQEDLSNEVRNCFHLSDDWLYEEYWL